MTVKGNIIRVDDATFARLQKLGTPFRTSELGTPEKVIVMLLDEHEGLALTPHELREEAS
jgi:hypothetical protein